MKSKPAYGKYVQGVIEHLWADPSSRRAATLAHLRAATGQVPGTDPHVWRITVGDLDSPETQSAAPSAAENAVHAALTLFAVHQQSKEQLMHVSGRRFASALRSLALAGSYERDELDRSPVFRRLTALTTAADFAEATHHARGLIQQLRAEEIGFDYGNWTDNLFYLQFPASRGVVQRQWGRDFFANTASVANESTQMTQHVEKKPRHQSKGHQHEDHH